MLQTGFTFSCHGAALRKTKSQMAQTVVLENWNYPVLSQVMPWLHLTVTIIFRLTLCAFLSQTGTLELYSILSTNKEVTTICMSLLCFSPSPIPYPVLGKHLIVPDFLHWPYLPCVIRLYWACNQKCRTLPSTNNCTSWERYFNAFNQKAER